MAGAGALAEALAGALVGTAAGAWPPALAHCHSSPAISSAANITAGSSGSPTTTASSRSWRPWSGAAATACPERRRVFADQDDGLASLARRERPRRGQRSLLRAASPQGKNGVPQLLPNAMLLPDVPQPPAAPRRAAAHVAHGDIRPDDWQWLANRDDPEVIAYLEAENAYTDAVLAPTDADAGTTCSSRSAPGSPRPTSRHRCSTTAGGIGPAPWPGSSTPCTAGEPTRARLFR